jgi:hypothetical protein
MKTVVGIYFLLCWVIGALGVIDTLLIPAKRFRAIGESKYRLVLIQLVGLPLVGVFTFAYYRFRVRPRLPVGFWGRVSGGFSGGSGGGGGSASSVGSVGLPPMSASARTPCGNCQGRGRIYESSSGSAWGQREVTCPRCGGSGF